MEADEMRRQSWARVPQISIDPTSMDALADPEEVDRYINREREIDR